MLGICLLVAGCDDSTAPLSDASQARLDKQLSGLWRHEYPQGVSYYHAGRLGGRAPEGVLRVVTVSHPRNGELQEPQQLIAFCSEIGGHSYLNLALSAQKQLGSIRTEGWKAGLLDSYILLKYEVDGDELLLWAMNKDAKEKAIEGGAIEGTIKDARSVRFTDTTATLADFVAAADDELFSGEPIRLGRVR
jgi:hypothetical protein